eukprot:CAMPEP_0194269976 /NCGR_PEP_ID=MMETSP0169-20130528/4061_1 /TAXON_ID=218684 /ORGANISM="Corethron pennatum, Strain L29A3" /LENGTH=168 /DNA_ID=CAMNT_0039011851 /DNA_START=150 /DNA_END=653 /DNA_ORIENTATION=+
MRLFSTLRPPTDFCRFINPVLRLFRMILGWNVRLIQRMALSSKSDGAAATAPVGFVSGATTAVLSSGYRGKMKPDRIKLIHREASGCRFATHASEHRIRGSCGALGSHPSPSAAAHDAFRRNISREKVFTSLGRRSAGEKVDRERIEAEDRRKLMAGGVATVFGLESG